MMICNTDEKALAPMTGEEDTMPASLMTRVVTNLQPISPQLCQEQLLRLLTRLLGPVDQATLIAVQAKLEWLRLVAGERLIEQGEASDALYLVVHGRLRVTLHPQMDEVDPRDDAAAGTRQPADERFVREIGLLTETPRTASVTAIRGSTVVRLSRAVYEELLAQHPQMMVQVARLMAGRQVGADAAAAQTVVTRTFALVGGDGDIRLSRVAARLAETLTGWGETLHLSSARFDERFGKAGAAQTPLADPRHLSIAGWLSEQETHYRFIVYEADRTWSAWTQRCTQQADSILIVKQASGDPAPDGIERALRASHTLTRQELVLLQPADCARPRRTAPLAAGAQRSCPPSPAFS
jgi:CRP-like cAMP-binding protein